MRGSSRPFAARLVGVLAAVALSIAVVGASAAFATIYEPPDDAVSSVTNPGTPQDYDVAWREGWGNNPLAAFVVKVPQPEPDTAETAILGAYYALQRPESFTATLTAAQWPSCYHAILVGKEEWPLFLDVPSEVAYPGPLNPAGWTPPGGVVLGRPYEGPFYTLFQFYAPNITTAWSGAFRFGLDMTPPEKVTGLVARTGFTGPIVSGVHTQSRVYLQWDDKVYDRLSGTGYFEVFIDGQPYLDFPDSSATTTRRVYDLQEHYPGYGFNVYTRRGLNIEDLPAGTHSLQVRAVDRATNAGPLSDPVTMTIDPDIPNVSITSPAVDGQEMGARPVFSADASDAGGVSEVRFYVDGILRATRVAQPYTTQVDLSAFADGSTHILRVEVDDVGGRTNFAEKTFVIDKTPQVSILAPTMTGSVMSAPAPVVALVNDAAGIDSITFRIDGSVIDSFALASQDTTRFVAMSIAPVTAGPHTFSVTAVSTSGGSFTTSRTFTADAGLRISAFDFAPPTNAAGEFKGESTTNPYSADDPQGFWRELWGNSLFPQFKLTSPEFPSTSQVEMLYSVDRNAMSQIDPRFPSTYDRSSNVEGTEAELLIDQHGLVVARPSLSGTTLFPGRALNAAEGIWYWHVLYRDMAGNTSGPYNLVYGVDVTKPAKVSGLAAYDSKESVVPAVGWLDQRRAVLKWDNAQQDALSGTAYYRVYVDGTCVVPGDPEGGSTLLDPVSGSAGVPWYHEGRVQESLTIESFGPGIHTIEVTAVDRAGNEGPKSDPLTVRLMSTPVVTIVSPPSVGTTLTTPALLRANVTDAAGIDRVEFRVDGALVRTFTPLTAGSKVLACSMYQPLPNGPHTLSVTAYSLCGSIQTETRAFNVDSALPPEVPGGDGSDDSTVTVETQWFNTVFPTFSALSGDTPDSPTELLYLVDRTPVNFIDPTDPNSFYGSFKPDAGTTHFNGVLDQQGIYLSDPDAFNGALQLPGRVSSPLEGIWYIHALIRNAAGEAGEQANVAYGVDLTRPYKVNNVRVYSSNTATQPLTGWTNQSRAVVRWESTERDLLSGTDYFKVYIDDKPLSEWESESGDNWDGLIDYQYGRSMMSVTIEDLPPGQHKVQVTAVDRAGNESYRSDTATLALDGDTPKVAILTPAASGVTLGLNSELTARATDGGAIYSVNFRIDGLSVGTVYPTSLTKDFTAKRLPIWTEIPTGTHTLTVTVTDMGGQTAVATRTFVLDRTAPTISSVSGSPNPFFPRKRDGYKDNFKVKFSTNEAGTARIKIYNSSGKLVRTVTKTVPKGSNSISWNGKQSDGVVRKGTFKWKLSMTDAAGNVKTTSSRSVTIKFYEIVRVSSGAVRIVER